MIEDPHAAFEAWLAAQPPPAHVVSGYEHAMYIRWCAERLQRAAQEPAAAILPAPAPKPARAPEPTPQLSLGGLL